MKSLLEKARPLLSEEDFSLGEVRALDKAVLKLHMAVKANNAKGVKAALKQAAGALSNLVYELSDAGRIKDPGLKAYKAFGAAKAALS